MTASRLPAPPPFVPTLTEVVGGAPLQHIPVHQPEAHPSVSSQAASPQRPWPASPQVDRLMQRLQADLANHLALRLQEQAPQWAAEWARGLGPELSDWARQVLLDLQNAQNSPDADPDKP